MTEKGGGSKGKPFVSFRIVMHQFKKKKAIVLVIPSLPLSYPRPSACLLLSSFPSSKEHDARLRKSHAQRHLLLLSDLPQNYHESSITCDAYRQRQLLIPLDTDLQILIAFDPEVLPVLLVSVLDLKLELTVLAIPAVLELQFPSVDDLLVKIRVVELTAWRHADDDACFAVEPGLDFDGACA
jgi:hypothetical protein